MAGLVIATLAAGPAWAVNLPSFSSADSKMALSACAAEREPLVERQKGYAELRRARLTAAMVAGAKAGFTVLAATSPLGLAAGGASRMMGQGGGQTGANGQSSASDSYTSALQAVSAIAAVGGSAEAYMKIKQEQFANDPRRMAVAVDSDAAAQLTVSMETAAQVTTLANCRDRQVAYARAQLAAASNDKDRKEAVRAQAGVKSALKTDFDLSDDVVGQQATLAKTYTQGRAMSEGKSEADILGGQPAAYGEASTTALKLPEPGGGRAGGPRRATSPSAPLRRARRPTPRPAVLMTPPAGRSQ